MLMRSSGVKLRIFKIRPTMPNAQVLAVWPSDAGRSYAWHLVRLVVDPSGRHLVLHNARSRVIVLDASDGRVVHRTRDWERVPGVCRTIAGAVLSGDGRTLTAGVKLNRKDYVVHLEPVDGDANSAGTYERPRQQDFADGEGKLKHSRYGRIGWPQTTSMARDDRGCTIIVTEAGVRIFDRDLTHSRQAYAFAQRIGIHSRWCCCSRCCSPGAFFVWFDAARGVLFGKTKANQYMALDLF